MGWLFLRLFFAAAVVPAQRATAQRETMRQPQRKELPWLLLMQTVLRTTPRAPEDGADPSAVDP